MEFFPYPPWLGGIIAGMFGLLAGSFFNVVIYRMPRGESVVFPASHCTQCGYKIKFYENVPVLSWLWLRGRCRSCGTSISLQYPLVEALTGLMAGLLGWYALGPGAHHPLDFKVGVAYLILTSIPIFIIDFRHFLIPDVLTYPGMILGLALSFLPAGQTPWESLSGGACAGGLLWVVGFTASKLLKKDAMGLGDVKLIGMAGCLFGLQTALLGLVFASILGTLVGLPQLLLKKLDEHHHIPFGPYICLGVLISAFAGDKLWHAYLNLLRW